MKKILTFFLTALLAFSVGWADEVSVTFSDLYSTNTVLTDVTIPLGNDVTITFAKPGGTAPQYYTNGSAVRWYARNTMTVASTKTITKIVLTFGSGDGSNAITTDVGSYSNGTWTGSASSVLFTVGGTSGNRRLSAVTVTYSGGGATVAPPTIDPNGGIFATSQQVTLSHADGGAIHYTLDDTDPTEQSTQYTTPFTITQTTTVKAIAVKNGVCSSVASATFTEAGVSTIAAAYAVAQNSQFIFTDNATVVYQSEDNKYLYIKDGSGWGLIYDNAGTAFGTTFTNGDILDPDWMAINTVYNGLPEFMNPVAGTFCSTSSGSPVEPVELTTLTNADLNKYATMSNITITSSSSGNYNFEVNGTVYQLRNQIGVSNLPNFTNEKTYNVRGFVGIYKTSNNTTYQLYPIWAEEVTTSDPTIEADPAELIITDATTGALSVTGSNISDNISSSLTGNDNEGWSLSTQSLPAAGGNLNVYYNARYLAADNNVELSASGATNVNVPVTYRPNLYIVGDYSDGNGWNFATGTPMTYNESDGTYTATITTNENSNAFLLFSKKVGDGAGWNNEQFLYGPVCDYSGNYNNNQNWELVENNLGGTHNLDLTNGVHHCIYIPAAKSGTYIITVNPPYSFTITREVVLTGDFTLVTDASQLAAGNEVIIVNSGTAGDAKAMSTDQKTNNRGETDVIVKPTFTVTATETTQIATLESDNDGWYFNVGDGAAAYLYAASNTANHLKTHDTKTNSNATISVDASTHVASIVFQGEYSHNVLQHNPGSNLFSCYASANQSPVYLYQRSAAPSISVQSTLDLVIPVGETSATETVTVTETNVTGTTTISSIDGDDTNFNVTLTGTTLSVTYNGTATEDNPEIITINLVNGEATASITVTAYKVPLTVTISPANGATFSENSMNGTITANNEDAVIYYKTNEMSDFEVYNGSFTVTNSATENPSVQAYAVCGGETSATATATYHHVSLSETLFTRVTSTNQLVAGNKYIIVYEDGDPKPLALHGEGLAESVAWSGDNINIAGTSTTVFTLGGTTGDYTLYNANYGYLTHADKSTRYTQTANSLTIYGSETYGYFVQEGSYDLRFNTDVNIQNDPFRWYNNGAGTEAVLYVQGVEETPSLTLADLVTTGEKDHDYTISDQLQAAKVTWDENYGKFAIFAKDDEMYANKRYPTDGMDEYLIAFENQNGTVVNTVAQKDYDQSNWIEILIPSSVTGKPHADYQSTLDELKLRFENKILAAGTVSGTYKDDLNPTLLMTGEPVVETSSGTPSTYVPNYYCTANFLQENLDANGAQSYRDNESGSGSYFMMDAKPQEFCKVVWAYYTGSGNYFVAPEREGDLVNGLRFRGSFQADMSLCEDQDVVYPDVAPYFVQSGSNTETATLYGFNAIVRKNPAYNATPANGAPSRIQAYTDGIEPTPAYIVYPLNAGANSDGNVTDVNEVVSGKTVESVRFYNLMGVESDKPFEGVNIVVTRYTDGSRSTVKVLR